MMRDNTVEAFFALVRAGLWETEVHLASYNEVDYERILRLAREQSVVGLVTAGIEHVTDMKVPQIWVLQFAGEAIQLEQRNKAMNLFIAELVTKMRNAGINTLLVKGQGIAQCYERPFWRASGDIDLFLSEINYYNAKDFLIPLASKVDEENPLILHLGMTIDSWEVELHGSLCSRLWKSVNNSIKEAQDSVFYEGRVRSWMDGKTQVFLPHADEDVVFVFTHILQHFYHEGIGLRQICDWIRLLFTYNDAINKSLLERRLKKMKVMSEWMYFCALAEEFLGMPRELMPLYSSSVKWQRKAKRLLQCILEMGNFGHNRDLSYYSTKPYIIRKFISFKRHTKDLCKHFFVFPMDTVRVWNGMMIEGIGEVIKGK